MITCKCTWHVSRLLLGANDRVKLNLNLSGKFEIETWFWVLDQPVGMWFWTRYWDLSRPKFFIFPGGGWARISKILSRILGLQLVSRGRNVAGGSFSSQISMKSGQNFQNSVFCFLSSALGRFLTRYKHWSLLKRLRCDDENHKYFLEKSGEAFHWQVLLLLLALLGKEGPQLHRFPNNKRT